MPKKSLTLNGFGGGLNLDADLSDLVSEGRDKDELSQADNILSDEKGKMTAKLPEHNNASDGLNPPTDGTSGTLLWHNGTIYHHQGAYTMGSHVNWSGNEDYEGVTPVNGDLNPSSSTWYQSNQISGLSMQFDANIGGDDIFVGASSDLNDGTTAIVFNSHDSTVLPNPSDYIRYGIDGDNNGQLQEGDDFDEIFRIVDSAVSAGSSTNGIVVKLEKSDGAFVDLDTDVNTVTVTDWEELQWYTDGTVNDDPAHVYFRGGYKSDIYGGLNGYYNNSGQSLRFPNVINKDILLDIKIESSTGLDGISIWFDTDSDDAEVHYGDSDYDSYCRIYLVTMGVLTDAGADTGYATIRIPYDSAIHVGHNFSTSNVRTIGIGPQYGGAADQNIATPDIRLRGFKLVSSSLAESTWGGGHYKFFQTTKNNGVESLLKEYDGVLSTESLFYPHVLLLTRPYVNASNTSYYDGNIYYQRCNKDGSGVGSIYLLAEYSKEDGVKPANSEDYTDWAGAYNIATIEFADAPLKSTYTLESGYPEGTREINATWKTAATVGRQVYIGNVEQGDVIDTSKILKSAIGKPAGFSDLQYIDLDFAGDSISVLQSVGDRLLVFSKDKLTIVNVAQDIEYVEAVFEGYGIPQLSGLGYGKNVCKIGEGVAFVNPTGVYIFDGQNIKDLTIEKVNSIIWDENNAAIAYDNKRKLLIVWQDDAVAYFYSLKSNSWVGKRTSWAIRPHSNSALGSDGNVYFEKSSAFYYLGDNDTTSVGQSFAFKTGNIDCGDLARTKKFYKAYITVSGSSGSGAVLKWSVDGGSQSTSPSLSDGLNEVTINANGKYIQLEVYANQNENRSFELGDISLIYREKTLK